MKPYMSVYSLIFSWIMGAGLLVSAAPSLPVTKSPVLPNPSFTGPTNDFHAIMGQSFQVIATSNLEYRTHEFYDNSTNAGGGYMGHLAISGQVVNIVKNFGAAILSFDIEAVIFNDTPAVTGWDNGTNNLLEFRNTGSQYTNTLKQVVLTADFAVTGDENGDAILPNFSTPYFTDVYSSMYIVTTNNDYKAWFGPSQTENNYGGFYVPGWSFGDILANSSSVRTLSFYIPGGISPSDPRYDAITNGADIFINRSLSLKISEFVSNPATDNDDSAATNSNVSVFHNTLEDVNQTITIKSIQIQSSPATILIKTMGNTNWQAPQIMQYCTNLMTTNWTDLSTSLTWPYPQTNSWVLSNATSAVQFYRIVQP